LIYLAAGGLLDVNPGLLIWTLVTFTIVVIILRSFAWNPIIHALDERAERIHGDIDRAQKIKKEAEELLANYTAKLNAARDEAIAIVNEAKSDAINLKNKTLEDTQVELKNMREQAKKDIELSKAKAVQELQEHVVELSVAIAGQILEKQLKKDDHATFVKSEIAKLKDLKAG
jgi:F-type H+-transporting ATPase subunit b